MSLASQAPASTASRDGMLRRLLHRRSKLLTIEPVERRLAGRAGGILYMTAGTSGLIHPLLPHAYSNHVAWLFPLSAAAFIWGMITVFVIDWHRADVIYTHISTFAAYIGIGVGVWASGGIDSFAWIYLVWIAMFGCYFYTFPVAVFYLAASVLVQAAPLVYYPHAVAHGFVAQLVVSAAGYVAIGLLVSKGKRLVAALRNQSETLAAEQGALQRAATAVIRGEHPDAVFRVIANEFSAAMRGNVGGVSEIVGPGRIRLMSLWTDGTIARPSEQIIGREFNLGPVLDRLTAGHVIRVTDISQDSVAGFFGCQSALYAPVIVAGELWGVLGFCALEKNRFTSDDVERIEAFSALVATIVSSLQDRARLERQAHTDQLTGLANHRALMQRLESDLHTAVRNHRRLSVALVDLDNFKEINDVGGHDRGDEALRIVAACLNEAARAADTVGRLGGDEFMWIMPDSDSTEAYLAVERVRRLISEHELEPRQVTTSAGICDTASSTQVSELIRRADAALYSSKATGRNRTIIYDANATLAARAREAWVERSQAMIGLRALARAIDAKDPATSDHSERVSLFAGRLAQAAGWSAEQVDRLREAALVHDLGKLSIPDSLLNKPGPLTEAERTRMNTHAEMSARIVDTVLSDEQVSWIRYHHERPDGRGYPAQLIAEQIPAGAALIALADSWDVMTSGRVYSASKSAEETYSECLELRGLQFCDVAVDALIALHDSGLLLTADPASAV